MKIKNCFLTAVTVGVLTPALLAAPTDQTNIALDINRSTLTTFSNTGGLFDGIINSEDKFSALSGDISKVIQQIAVPLKDPAYLREIRIYWDVASDITEYQVQYSQDGRKWFNLNRTRATKDKTSIVHYFDGAGRSAKGLRIQIPIDRTQPDKKFRIQELEIYPSTEVRNTIRSTQVMALADTEAIVQINGSLDGDKWVELLPAQGNNQKPTTYRALDPNEAVVLGLQPDQSYFFLAKMQDFNRNQAQSDRQTLRAERINLALGKKVTGTFNVNPGETGFKAGDNLQNRITDGGFDFFSQSATSGSIYNADQNFVINLERVQPVKKIILYWRGLSYPNQYQVLVSNDNQNWKLIKDKINAGQGAVCMLPGNGQLAPGVVQQIDLNTTAQYVKVLIPQNSPFTAAHSNWEFVQIFEAKVF